jgi:hypothetical protein
MFALIGKARCQAACQFFRRVSLIVGIIGICLVRQQNMNAVMEIVIPLSIEGRGEQRSRRNAEGGLMA